MRSYAAASGRTSWTVLKRSSRKPIRTWPRDPAISPDISRPRTPDETSLICVIVSFPPHHADGPSVTSEPGPIHRIGCYDVHNDRRHAVFLCSFNDLTLEVHHLPFLSFHIVLATSSLATGHELKREAAHSLKQ